MSLYVIDLQPHHDPRFYPYPISSSVFDMISSSPSFPNTMLMLCMMLCIAWMSNACLKTESGSVPRTTPGLTPNNPEITPYCQKYPNDNRCVRSNPQQPPLLTLTANDISFTIDRNGSCSSTPSLTKTPKNTQVICPSPQNFEAQLKSNGGTTLIAPAKVQTTWKISFRTNTISTLTAALDPQDNFGIDCEFDSKSPYQAKCVNIFNQEYTGDLNFKIYSSQHCKDIKSSLNQTQTCTDLNQYPNGSFITKTVPFKIINVNANLKPAEATSLTCAASNIGNQVARQKIEDVVMNILAQSAFAIINANNNCPTAPISQ